MKYDISEHAHRINIDFLKVEELLAEIARLSDDNARLNSALRHWLSVYGNKDRRAS